MKNIPLFSRNEFLFYKVDLSNSSLFLSLALQLKLSEKQTTRNVQITLHQIQYLDIPFDCCGLQCTSF
jgi:hypothetical protein